MPHIAERVRSFISVFDRLTTRDCVFCGNRCLDGEGLICAGCDAELPRNRPACPACAAPRAAPLAQNLRCGSCQLEPPPFTAAVAPLRYEYPVDAAIRRMKFNAQLYYVPAFRSLLREAYDELAHAPDAVLPVPLHWRRQASRGFNQAEELARPLCRDTGLPLLRGVRRIRATPYQSGLDSAARQRNLRDAFAIRGQPAARHVLIVDDVITTGSTAAQLAVCLLESGVESVGVLALARA